MRLRSLMHRCRTLSAGVLAALALAACGDGSTALIGGYAPAGTYLISGKISGLAPGQQLVLLNNGSDPIMLSSAGVFTFTNPVALDGSYAITVGTQPAGETCTVSGGTGAGVTANIDSIIVTCSNATFSIGGTVSGLATGQSVSLLNNGADATLTGNGAFTFSTPVVYDSSYAVTVGTEPTSQTCSVSGGSGSGVTANISAVSVNCSTATFLIGGTIAGLASGQQVTLDDNGADPLTATANGAFTFAKGVAYDGSYAVSVGTQPTGQGCSVSGADGSGVTANIASVDVTCSTDTYTIGGSMSGLANGAQVTLLNNGADAATLTAAGSFSFATAIPYGGSYAVTVGTQPTGQTCTVTGGSGMNVMAAVSTVGVTCSASTFSIGGSIAGLGSGLQVTLRNNGANPTTLVANGGFTFSIPVVYNGSYAVSVGTQPVGQNCTVSAGSGNNVESNVSGIGINCVASPTYSVSGTVSGISGSGQSFTLENNGLNPVVYNANGSYTFATGIAAGGSYSLTVSTQPAGDYECLVANGMHANVTANDTNVTIDCFMP